ncbi:MAG: ISAzo13 family transposase, partial [Candidatus Kuenenia stuttgartiensis]|nr:ISAzo13 family transposase [Candidatus Kuenenia stuttgartiensis]
GWINVGCDHDTSDFAVQSIHRWWTYMGRKIYPDAKKLLICADSGGSDGYRVRLWKIKLQEFANKSGMEITVCHFPKGTSKWNKIEHRLFSHISMNWKGHPLTSHDVMVNLIGATKTKTGLKVVVKIDKRKYPTGIKVSDQEMEKINIGKHNFH